MYAYGSYGEGFHPRSGAGDDSPRVQELRRYLQLLAQAVQHRRDRSALEPFTPTAVEADDVTSHASSDASESDTPSETLSATVSETDTQSRRSEDGAAAESAGTGTEASEISLRNDPVVESIVEAPLTPPEETQIAFPIAQDATESVLWSMQSARMALRSFPIELA